MHKRIPGVSKRRTLSLGASALLSLSFVVAACSIESEPTPPDGTSGTGGISGGAGGASGTAGSSAGTGGAPQAGTGGTGTGGLAGGGQGGSTAGKGGAAGQGGSAATSGAGGSIASGAGGVATGGTGGVAGTGAGAGGMAGSGGSMGGGAGTTAGTGMGGAASGAGGTGAGAGGSSGSSGFAPCPASAPCKILPLGDSITDGIGFSGGYRVELFSLALADDHDITYVGGSMNGPQMVDGVTFPRAHEGHSGWTISQIDGIVPSPALGPDPNIILLHIGTNDMYQGASGATDRLETLVDAILADQPNSLLVVSNIIPFPGASGAVTTFNAAVPGIVSERAAAGKHILFVDQFMGFPTSELGDGVHPNQAGYERMARKWYEAISSYL